MATIKYASTTALTELVTKIKGLLSGKVDVVSGYSLTKNDLTDALKTNYDAAYSHSQADHAPADAEKNVIVGLTVNGTAVDVNASTRIAAITTATKVSDLTNDSNFQTDSQVSTSISTALASYYTKTEADSAIASAVAAASHLKYSIVSALPTADISDTTIYLVAKASTANNQSTTDAYTEYMYINSAWEVIGDTSVDLSSYSTTDQMNAAISNALADYVKTADLTEITTAEVDALF
jgi:hypothetical protein